MGERNHVRVDYFKLNRFQETQLARDIEFGDFTFDAGDTFRSKLDWRMLSLTYTYSLLKSERFEAGLGLGIHILEVKAEGSEPGTLNREGDSEVGAAPTFAANAAFRISKRWAVTARAQTFQLERENEFSGELSDFHADVQYRWRKNFAVGLGYTRLVTDIDIIAFQIRPGIANGTSSRLNVSIAFPHASAASFTLPPSPWASALAKPITPALAAE